MKKYDPYPQHGGISQDFVSSEMMPGHFDGQDVVSCRRSTYDAMAAQASLAADAVAVIAEIKGFMAPSDPLTRKMTDILSRAAALEKNND